ncbi:hypothetical protein LEP1GSC059_2474 [Leptospira noguchii serovar Panama str. CZ214]|uniref:Uncharacterized protein n=1 Tax=Leptospira noguchii serovar Panama str. CZ214 TaxID=1001595 RepID=T0FHD7_9LEPT|nr:hypothetical protein LEP1GSC059_2474 [Leptospira noguchii serovar Panama str. CZ214]
MHFNPVNLAKENRGNPALPGRAFTLSNKLHKRNVIFYL